MLFIIKNSLQLTFPWYTTSLSTAHMRKTINARTSSAVVFALYASFVLSNVPIAAAFPSLLPIHVTARDDQSNPFGLIPVSRPRKERVPRRRRFCNRWLMVSVPGRQRERGRDLRRLDPLRPRQHTESVLCRHNGVLPSPKWFLTWECRRIWAVANFGWMRGLAKWPFQRRAPSWKQQTLKNLCKVDV